MTWKFDNVDAIFIVRLFAENSKILIFFYYYTKSKVWDIPRGISQEKREDSHKQNDLIGAYFM